MKLLSTIYIVVLFVCCSRNIECMETEDKSPSYFDLCREIKKENKKKLSNFIEHACSHNSDEQLRNIEAKLIRYEKKINQQEEDILVDIKLKNKVSEDDWKGAMNLMHQYNELTAKEKHIPLDYYYHDDNLPAYLLVMIKKHLNDRGYNSARFNILRTYGVCGFAAQNISFEIKNSTMRLKRQPGLIALDDQSIKNVSIDAQEGACIHVINAATDKRGIILYIMQNHFKRNISICYEDHPVSISNLTTLMNAVKNARDAQLLMTLLEEVEVPGISTDTYREICKINRLHKCLEWLKRYAEDAGKEKQNKFYVC